MPPIKPAVAVPAMTFFAAFRASADTISNPINTYPNGPLSGAILGGNQTMFMGETFTTPISGALTNFQFTLGDSSIKSLYAAVYIWDGNKPTTLLWKSPEQSGVGAGLLNFSPVGVNLAVGQTYVAFLSTYGIAGNAGTASFGSYISASCNNVNANPYLGNLVWSTIYDDTVPLPTAGKTQTNWNQAGWFDATFS